MIRNQEKKTIISTASFLHESWSYNSRIFFILGDKNFFE